MERRRRSALDDLAAAGLVLVLWRHDREGLSLRYERRLGQLLGYTAESKRQGRHRE